ncbi:MAG: hypothetical protein AAF297_08580 [Planctomycetota bacterium]
MTSSRPRQPVLMLAAAGSLAALGLMLGGCGSSPRSDFYNSRGVIATPVAGSGQTLGEDMASRLAQDSAPFATASTESPADEPSSLFAER